MRPDAPPTLADAGASHLFWNAQGLWRQIEPYLPGVSVEVLAHAESTNSLLLERARRGAGRAEGGFTAPGGFDDLRARGTRGDDEPFGRRAADAHACLLVAEHQTLGRGRLGRSWMSVPGASLTFSLGVPMAPRDWWGLSLAAGVALADALDPREPGVPPRVGLKWPNDLWLIDAPGRGRKLGGILIETVAVRAARMVVVGVGLNIAALPAATGAARDLTHGFACLQEIDPAATAPAALHRVALPLVRALQQFEREGFAGFVHPYAQRDLLAGQRVSVLDPARGDAVAEGRCEGVAANGALLVRRDDGSVLPVTSGEVSVRLDSH
ncbi:MAG TPA: biotin--[acetyl-CoA-carboxylase] ligase [Burkholderiaceae bacterium]|nr:biotin--[acetyl-CoA-carboxylase] ligase [Burkholderiaceae bacterium]